MIRDSNAKVSAKSAFPSLLSTSPQRTTPFHFSMQPSVPLSFLRVHQVTAPPLYEIISTDWIKWPGIPEMFFSTLGIQENNT